MQNLHVVWSEMVQEVEDPCQEIQLKLYTNSMTINS